MIESVTGHITICDGCRTVIANFAIEQPRRLFVRDCNGEALCAIDLCATCLSHVYHGTDVTVKLNRKSLG